MHTTPPMVMASAPNAGAVHPLTRKIALVAISVAMVMPETGDADEPTMPTMRAETVTNRKPKTTTSSAAAAFASGPTYAPGTGLNWRKRNIRTISNPLPPKTTHGRQIVLRARRQRRRQLRPALVEALSQRADNCRQGADQGNQPRCRNRACAHGPNVGAPQVGGQHVFYGTVPG
jgi:hypothetical protein